MTPFGAALFPSPIWLLFAAQGVVLLLAAVLVAWVGLRDWWAGR